MNKKRKLIASKKVPIEMLGLNILVALIYSIWWMLPSHNRSNPLFLALIAGEVYHLFLAGTFWYTVWPRKNKSRNLKWNDNPWFEPSVSVFITVCGEPVEIVRETVRGAKRMEYNRYRIYILNDGKVAKKDNWKEIEIMAREEGVECITREIPGGNKAGNVNNGLGKTKSDLVAIFDADMVPEKDFLARTIPYFEEADVGFVQTPQYYKNKGKNQITSGAWDQQELFFGAIMRGKDNSNSAFICGTNFVIRRETFEESGGLVEDNIAEDFVTSIAIHQRGWRSVYVPKVLAKGLAPEDMLSYYKQQLRWARGSLQVLLNDNPLLKRGLSMGQKMQYLSSAMYYFNGVVIVIDMVLPLLFLFFGWKAVEASSTSFAFFFLPFMFFNLYTLSVASAGRFSYRAVSFSSASFTLQILALKSILLNQKMGFSVTPKQQQEGNFLYLAYPHMVYIMLGIVGTGVGLYREGFNSSVATNSAWVIFNIMLFVPFIAASYNWKGWWNRTKQTLVGGNKVWESSGG